MMPGVSAKNGNMVFHVIS